MVSKEEAQSFLSDFHQKMKIWEIRFRDDRGKNTQALLSLEMSPVQRIKIIEVLSIIDYSEGPKTDTLNAGAPLWVFGRPFKNRMIYIKVSLGSSDHPVICISFHEAEHKMKFPFKGE